MTFYKTDLLQGEVNTRISFEDPGEEEIYDSGHRESAPTQPGVDVLVRYSPKNLDRIVFGGEIGNGPGIQGNMGYTVLRATNRFLPTIIFAFGGSRQIGAGLGSGIKLANSKSIQFNLFYSMGLQQIEAPEITDDGMVTTRADAPLAYIERQISKIEMPVAIEIPIRKLRFLFGASTYWYTQVDEEEYRFLYNEKDIPDNVYLEKDGIPFRFWVELSVPFPIK